MFKRLLSSFLSGAGYSKAASYCSQIVIESARSIGLADNTIDCSYATKRFSGGLIGVIDLVCFATEEKTPVRDVYLQVMRRVFWDVRSDGMIKAVLKTFDRFATDRGMQNASEEATAELQANVDLLTQAMAGQTKFPPVLAKYLRRQGGSVGE